MVGQLLLCQLASALSQQLLLNRVPASSVDPRLLLSTLPIDAGAKARALAALEGGSLLVTEPLLSAAECLAVRRWATPRIDTRALDSVDGVPEQQVTVPLETLRALVGERAFLRLWGWPGAARRARAPRACSAFVRKYSPSSKRALLPFHLDSNELTVNVALTADADVRGGRLLALHDGRVREVARAAGDATLHDSSVCHAVSAVSEGARYSLLLFFYAEPRDAPRGAARSGAGARPRGASAKRPAAAAMPAGRPASRRPPARGERSSAGPPCAAAGAAGPA